MVNKNEVILKTIQIFVFLGLCNSSYCKMNCNNWFTNEMQLELNNNLMKMSQKELRIYLLQNVKKINDKNKWEFYLNNRLVCPKLFANTIGHKNLVSIKRFFKTHGIDNRYRNRNKWKQHSNEFNNKIKNFLLSFEPNYSHYSLKSTPNRLFIPSIYAMNSIKLYKEFCGRNGFLPKIHKTLNTNLKRDVKRTEEELEFCNFEYFEKMRKKLNIHFEKVTNDLCSTCTEHSLHHNKQYNEEFCSCVCDLCKKFNIDLKNAKNSRIQMRKEAKSRDNTHENVYLSADMQKAMLFPIIKVKNNYFNEKLTLYNQTFSELGQKSHAFCYLSFDGEVGKSANEFVNYYLKKL